MKNHKTWIPPTQTISNHKCQWQALNENKLSFFSIKLSKQNQKNHASAVPPTIKNKIKKADSDANSTEKTKSFANRTVKRIK